MPENTFVWTLPLSPAVISQDYPSMNNCSRVVSKILHSLGHHDMSRCAKIMLIERTIQMYKLKHILCQVFCYKDKDSNCCTLWETLLQTGDQICLSVQFRHTKKSYRCLKNGIENLCTVLFGHQRCNRKVSLFKHQCYTLKAALSCRSCKTLV